MHPTLCSDNILVFKTSGAVPLKPYLQVCIDTKAAFHCPTDYKEGRERVNDIDPVQVLVV
jgi:hypothetical protein